MQEGTVVLSVKWHRASKALSPTQPRGAAWAKRVRYLRQLLASIGPAWTERTRFCSRKAALHLTPAHRHTSLD
jgi:hypothetical protein